MAWGPQFDACPRPHKCHGKAWLMMLLLGRDVRLEEGGVKEGVMD